MPLEITKLEGTFHDALNVVFGMKYMLVVVEAGPHTGASSRAVNGLAAALKDLEDIILEARRGLAPNPKLQIISISERLEAMRNEMIPILEAEYDIKIKLTTNVSPDCQAYSDNDRAKQVMRNIIGNAAEAGATKIHVHYHEREDVVHVLFNDNGPGISPEKLMKIGLTSDHGDSGGIGIPLIRSLVNMAGGTVHWSSHQGIGTTVEIKLRKVKQDDCINCHGEREIG